MRKRIPLAAIFGLVVFFISSAAQAVITLQFVPSSQQGSVGTPVTVAIKIAGLGDLTAPSLSTFDLNINFDPTILGVSNVNYGDPNLKDQLNVLGLGSLTATTPGSGFVELFELSLDSPADLDTLQRGAFTLATVTFTTLAAGTSPLSFTVNALGDALGETLEFEAEGGSITIVTPTTVNSLVSFAPIKSTFQTTADVSGCPAGFVGKFSFTARLTDQSTSPPLSDLVAKVSTLTGGNLLENADGGPGGVGATLTVPQKDGFSDGVLSPEEFVDVPFVICLKEKKPFSLFVDVVGIVD